MKQFVAVFSSALASILLAGCASTGSTSTTGARSEKGFISLFDGTSLKGWTLVGKHGDGFGVKDGVLFCAKGGGGNLLTEQEFADFILRFDFKLEEGSNNGIGIRAPRNGDAAYLGMEIQVLDDNAPKWAKLRPNQYHGSIYDVAPARRGALRPSGEWNSQEISAIGRQITVTLNGQVILSTNLNSITDLAVLAKHPGLLRDRGHIGFLGHNDYVEFRNIRIKEIARPVSYGSPMSRFNVAPPGFKALFNGVDLTGWKGLLAPTNDNPFVRAKLSPEARAKAQQTADEIMRRDWRVENGSIRYVGTGFENLCTARDYANYELLVDWRIEPKADSGLYLRGTPQVQIWDDAVGSGGLFNNKTNASKPTRRADRLAGEWNRFRILMAGECVTVFLNEELVVPNVPLENYWAAGKPLLPSGPIELQAHKTVVEFRNIYVRELTATEVRP